MVDRRLGRAWVALTLALAVHAVDEAAKDFLSVYNPTAGTIRARLGTAFPPPLEFGEWVAGLILVVLVLLALSTLAFSGERVAVWLAFPYAALMFANGVAHVTVSIVAERWMPGVWSAPLLLAASAYLFLAAIAARHRADGAGGRPRE